MAITYVGVTSQVSSGAVPIAFPQPVYIGDLLMLFVESANETIATPSGWTPIGTQAGTGSAASAGGVRLAAFYKFATQTEVNATTIIIADSGNHTYVAMMSFRGVSTTSPINVASAYAATAASTAMTFPTVTTTVNDCWVINACALDFDGVGGRVSGWTNSGLSSLIERFDDCSTTGVGGGLAINTGVRSSAGAVGATTATQASALAYVALTVALTPALTDTVQPTILSSNTLTAWETVAFTHTLTASEAVTWSIVGGLDAAKFSVTGSTLSLPAQNYEVPTDSNADRVYNVIVRATDASNNTTDQTINVTVLDIDETVTLPSSGTFIFTTVGPGAVTVPAGVTQIATIECWGGGGGSVAGGANQGGGGGGAYSAITNLAVTPGQTIYYNVGKGGVGDFSGVSLTYSDGGDSWFNATTYAAAPCAAQGARNNNSGIFNSMGGGQASAGIGTTKFSGGNGVGAGFSGDGTGSSTKGVGGASASPTGNGETITNSTLRGGNSPGAGAGGVNGTPSVGPQPGVSNVEGGGGAGGGNASVINNSQAAAAPGVPGGGAGGGNTSTNALNFTNGARGQIRITYSSGGTPPEPTRRAPRSSHLQ